MSIYILPILLLLLGLIVGWLLRGRRSFSELRRLKMSYADVQYELEETRTASEAKKRELAAVKLELKRSTESNSNKKPFSYQAVETQRNSSSEEPEHPLDERREGLRRASERQAADTVKVLTENKETTENSDVTEKRSTLPETSSENTFFDESNAEGNSNEYFAKSQTSFTCLLYTSPSPRDKRQSRMPSSA